MKGNSPFAAHRFLLIRREGTMGTHGKFSLIKTKDVRAIMQAIHSNGILSRTAYCRLHSYIVTLERLQAEDAGIIPEGNRVMLTTRRCPEN
jgi:hypothetical protein